MLKAAHTTTTTNATAAAAATTTTKSHVPDCFPAVPHHFGGSEPGKSNLIIMGLAVSPNTSGSQDLDLEIVDAKANASVLPFTWHYNARKEGLADRGSAVSRE